MLVLTRKRGEAIRIAETIEVRVLEIRQGRIRLGISGPAEVPVHRKELWERRVRERRSDRAAIL